MRLPDATIFQTVVAQTVVALSRQSYADTVFIIMSETFIMIPGRTSKQGCGINEGKYGETYQSEITKLQVPPEDMQRLGLDNGDRVRVTSEFGQIDVNIAPSKGDELPPGMLFIAYGDLSSKLMGGDTHGSGMPTSKGFDVQLEKIS